MTTSAPTTGTRPQLIALVAIGLGCSALGIWTGHSLAGSGNDGPGRVPTARPTTSQTQPAPLRSSETNGNRSAARDSEASPDSGELRVPAEFLRAGYFPSISGPSTVRDEIAELLTLTDQERAEISAALHDTFKGFRKEFLAGARLLGEAGGGETQIQIKPVSSSRAASLHHEFESRLAGAVGKDRASIFRLFADKALRQKLADFGTAEQVVIIRDKNGMRYFDRYAIDPESGERRQSPLETGSWSLERDEEFRQTTDNQGTFFKRPLLELAGLW